MFQTKVVVKIKKTHFMFFFFLPRILPDRPQMMIRPLRLACWISKATNTHSEYEILIAFPLQQWLQERTSVLRYTYIASVDIFELAQPVCRHAIRRAAEESVFDFWQAQNISSLHHNVQTGAGVHPVSYSVGTVVLSPGTKRSWCESFPSLLSSVEYNNM